MSLHFAYGSNMSCALMRARCPQAHALGTAALRSWRYVISANGYASIVPAPGCVVHGVLWRLSVRDRAALDLYEDVESGAYRRRTIPVAWEGRRVAALVYLASAPEGLRPKPGYQDVVIEAARDWGLPERYISSIARCSGARKIRERAAETGDATGDAT